VPAERGDTTTTKPLSTAGWTHLQFVARNDSDELFVNGVSIAQEPRGGTLILDQTVLRLGGKLTQAGNSDPLNLPLDEVRVELKARTKDEVKFDDAVQRDELITYPTP
jgi:hypothetical protein